MGRQCNELCTSPHTEIFHFHRAQWKVAPLLLGANGTLHKSHQPLDVNQFRIWAKEQWLTAAVRPPELPAASICVQWTSLLRVHDMYELMEKIARFMFQIPVSCTVYEQTTEPLVQGQCTWCMFTTCSTSPTTAIGEQTDQRKIPLFLPSAVHGQWNKSEQTIDQLLNISPASPAVGGIGDNFTNRQKRRWLTFVHLWL